MLPALIPKLKSLYQNALQELRKTPIQSSAALVVIGGVLIQIMITLWTRGSSSNPIIKILSTNTDTNLLLIILSLGLLAWSLITLHQQNKNTKIKFEFLDYGGVSWKIKNPYTTGLEVDFPSYCVQHRIQHFLSSNRYLCPVCVDKHFPYMLHSKLHDTRKAVENIAKAKRDKHAQRAKKS